MHSLRKNCRFMSWRTLVVVEPCGTDESVPYEKNQHFFFQHTTATRYRSGMHKCIPYETHLKLKFQFGNKLSQANDLT